MFQIFFWTAWTFFVLRVEITTFILKRLNQYLHVIIDGV